FYVVIDCGSTGNRVYVYRASVNHEKGDDLPISLKSLPESFERRSSGRAYNRKETEPGLDKLVNDVARLKKALKPLIKWAEKQIPARSHENTSLFLYATAGVRRLPRSDSDWLLRNSLSILKSSRFSCKPEWIKIITGMEEAYYGWIALNYHAGVLGSVPKRETFGALDLGGSSLQVTFEGNADTETSLNLSIGAVKHQVSAYSLAGYGLNDAFDKSVARVFFRTLPDAGNADPSKGTVEVKHPCLHSGYEAKYSCALCGSVPQKNETGRGNERASVRLVGSPNWDKCVELAELAVNMSEWSDRGGPAVDCKSHPCALDGHLPRPAGRFYVMSGFYVVYRFFNLTGDASLNAVLEKGREFCGKPWDAARSSVAPQPLIEQYCFRAPYAVLLLREGLQISDSQISVGSGSITWTLGVALFEAGKAFPYGRSADVYRTLRASVDARTVLIIFFASLFILLAAVSCSSGGGGWRLTKKAYLPFFKRGSAASSSSSVLNIPASLRLQWWSPI
ncbi:nucleoside phosphatase family protein, partial [Genlisea aurea]